MKKIICALCIGLFCTIVIGSDFASTETALAQSVIRLHVIANSDSDGDQALKLKVRDAIIKKTNGLFDDNGNIDSARTAAAENLAMIEKCAREEIEKKRIRL